jgi:glycosyltransferase involved in cell wall biosynthesis
MYIRDGINGDNIEVLPVGCDTDAFIPYAPDDPKILAVRESMGISSDQLMILTVGGDATSKGAQEVMQALAMINDKAPDWKYVCKVWPQPRTDLQNLTDLELAKELGIEQKVTYETNVTSRNFMPYLIGACDIYAAPSRLEGFGMAQVEAGACEKPVIGMKAMGMLDTLEDGETAYLANVAQKIVTNEVVVGYEAGFEEKHKVIFDLPRTVDYRANVDDIACIYWN